MEQGLGHVIHLKTAAIEDALDRATIRLGIYTLITNIYIVCFSFSIIFFECRMRTIGLFVIVSF